MKRVLLFAAVICFIVDASPMDLINPKVKVTLLSRSMVSPTRAVMVDNMLYYATKTTEDGCPSEASDLYAYSLVERKEIKLLSIPCVERLDADGGNIYILHHTSEKKPSYGRLASNEIIPILGEEAIAMLEARITMKLHQEEIIDDPELFPMYFANGDRLLTLMITQSAARVYLADIFRLDNQKPFYATGAVVLRTGSGKANPVNCQGLSFFGDRITLALSEGSSQLAKIAVLSAVDGKLIRELGGNIPLPKSWGDQPVSKERWAIRKPLYLLDVPGGFFVADRTAWSTEARSVSYFSEKEALFFRVGIYSKSLGGLSHAHGGLVVSYPSEGEVSWFGSANPFSNQYVRSEDVAPNPYLLQKKGETK